MIVDGLGACDPACPLTIAGVTSNHGPGPGETHDPRVEYRASQNAGPAR